MRHEQNLCRLCATYNKNMATIQLFERDHKCVLRRIFLLAGIKLKNQKSYPSVICINCELELNRAYAFRERCITAQAYFSSKEYRAQSIKDCEGNCNEPESNLVKLEVAPCRNENEKTAEDLDLATESTLHLKVDDTTAPTSAATEFIAFKEEINSTFVYDDEVDRLDHELDYEKEKSLNCNKTVAQIETDLETSTKESERLGKDAEHPVVNELKTEHKEKKTQKTKKLSNKADGKQSSSIPRIYICDQCGNNFKYRAHFKMHIKRHTGVKPVQCEVCPNQFFTEGELKRHMRRHTGERPFACQHCDRRFTDYSTRIKHERTHTNERPFKCEQCGKAFTTNYVLKNHKLVHSGERMFGCTLCNKSFQRQTHLVVHRRSLAHKQNVEREQYKLTQQAKVEGAECFPSQI